MLQYYCMTRSTLTGCFTRQALRHETVLQSLYTYYVHAVTLAPSLANAIAVALPMPVDAPVTRATFPFILGGMAVVVEVVQPLEESVAPPSDTDFVDSEGEKRPVSRKLQPRGQGSERGRASVVVVIAYACLDLYVCGRWVGWCHLGLTALCSLPGFDLSTPGG